MRNFLFSFLVLSIFASPLLAVPRSAAAVAVGLSPSMMELVMHQGQVADVFYSVSRSETEGDFSLEVSINDESGAVTLSNGNMVTIPAGKNNQTYHFSIDTHGLQPGEYSATMNFQEMLPENSGEVLSIRYGLQGGVNLRVVSEGEYNQIVFENPVKLSRLSIDSDVISAKKGIPVSYEITNPGPVFIDQIAHSIEVVSPDGEVIERVDYTDTVNLAPYQNVIFNKLVTIDTPGEYSLRVRAMNDGQDFVENNTNVIVEESTVIAHRKVEFGVVALAVAILLAIIVAFKLRGKNR